MEKLYYLENENKSFTHLSVGNPEEERLPVARALNSAKERKIREQERKIREQERKIREQERKIRELEHDAHHDPLTGVLDQRGLDNQLEIMTREKYSPEGLLFIDLTNFKAVNDGFSHQEGNKVLISMTELLKSTIRKNDKIARIGGDEFIIILGDETSELEYNTDLGNRDIDGIDPDTKILYAKSRIENEMKDFLDQNDHLKKVGFDLAVGGVVWKPGDTYEKLSELAEEEMTKYKAGQHEASGRYRIV